MRRFLQKFMTNNIIVIITGLPNLAINLSIQFVLDIYFHWSGALALLAYLIGTGASIQYGVLYAMFTKSNFTLGRWKYHFSHVEEKHE